MLIYCKQKVIFSELYMFTHGLILSLVFALVLFKKNTLKMQLIDLATISIP